MKWVMLTLAGAVICLTSEVSNAQKLTIPRNDYAVYFKQLDKGKRERLRQIYNLYIKDRKLPMKCSYLVLNNLSRAGATIETPEAFDCINSYLAVLEHDQRLQKQYKSLVTHQVGPEYTAYFNSLVKATDRVWATHDGACPLKTANSGHL